MEDREPELILDSIELIPESAQREPKEKKVKSGLYIRVDNINSPNIKNAIKLFSRYSGNYNVVILETATNKRFSAPNGIKVRYDEMLISELNNLLGTENIKFVK